RSIIKLVNEEKLSQLSYLSQGSGSLLDKRHNLPDIFNG
ncbi:unnamed protein product, partial [marine sediment metagenome]